LLLVPDAGDVVFVARAPDDSRQKIYAYKSILAGNSEYFASRKFNLEIALKAHRLESGMDRSETNF
jgi:hypothetical protein